MHNKLILFFSLLLVTTAAFAQTRQISGKVSDAAGQSIAGADVFVVGTTNGTTTDQNGNYVLMVSPKDVIRFAFLGFVDQDIKVENRTSVNVTLVEDTQFLDEIVVVGYGTIKKSSAAGSQSSVSDKAFANQRVSRIDQALQGRATGVQVTNTGGAPGAEVRIRIRGANSILGDNSPLFVVDGFVGADFNDINPNDILSMEILKDAASTAIYGSRGANGVVLVTTKNGAKNEKVSLSYVSSFSISNVLKKFDLLDAAGFAQVYNEYQEAIGSTARYTMSDFAKNGGFDYQDYVFRTAFGQQHQLALAGGSGSTQYRVSGNFLKHEGIIKPSEFRRTAINANVNSQVSKRLAVRFSASGIVSTGSRTAGDYTGANGVLTQALGWAPVTNPYADGGGVHSERSL